MRPKEVTAAKLFGKVPVMTVQRPHDIFDRRSVRHHRARASRGYGAHNALASEVETLLMERVLDFKKNFASILVSGGDGSFAKALADHYGSFTVAADISDHMLRSVNEGSSHPSLPSVALDDEALPFGAESFDLIASPLALHWCNDVPGVLRQFKNALKSDGVFLAALIGGQSLHELRSCLLEAELQITQGVSPRVSPSIDVRTATELLQRAGFALPVTDIEPMTFVYRDAYELMRDVRGMGEGNAHRHRLKHMSRRAILDEAARLYQSRFATAEGHVTASVDIIFLHGWKS